MDWKQKTVADGAQSSLLDGGDHVKGIPMLPRGRGKMISTKGKGVRRRPENKQ